MNYERFWTTQCVQPVLNIQRYPTGAQKYIEDDESEISMNDGWTLGIYDLTRPVKPTRSDGNEMTGGNVPL